MAPEAVLPPTPGTIKAELQDLYRSWRILDLVGETVNELPPEWLRILEIARNLMLQHPLPGVELPEDVARLVSPSEPIYTTQVRVERKKRVVYPLTDDTQVQPLRNLTDFPQVTLPDMMLRAVSQELFDFRLISGGINGLYNIDTGPAEQEYDEVIEVRVPTGGVARKKRQKVYALLDVSNSMRDANKETFAKALLLAYLLIAAEEGSELYLRTFGNTVHARSDCRSIEEFAALAQRILRVTPDGSTDIKVALDTAVGDIRALDSYNTLEHLGEAPPTEILLISDCETYEVPYLPQGIRLHTVHLKGGRMMKAYREGFERIRAESKTFNEIDTTLLRMPDSARDRWLLEQDGKSLETNLALRALERASNPAEQQRQELLQVYRRMAETRGKRKKGARKVSGMALAPAFAFMDALRRIVAAVRRVFVRPEAERWHEAPQQRRRTPLGVRVRTRR
ncbi:MAG: VWA domain-containing protein [Dehalococcoidia bacterium]|nr:VWA domain-containing protein [Dehalococcoidia bacterium]